MNRKIAILALIPLVILFIITCFFTIFYENVKYDSGIKDVESKYYNNYIDEENVAYDKYGYTFVGWSTVKGDSNYIISYPYKLDKSITLYAIYKINSDMNLPIFNINTENFSLITSKNSYVNSTINVSNSTNNTSDLSCKIRLRGNSTFHYDKKPYKLKFNLPTSLLGFSNKYHYVLLADYLDTSLIKNYTALSISKQLTSLKTIDFKHVELYVNGIYQGVYLLTHQIEPEEETEYTTTEVPFLIEKDNSVLGVTDEINKDYFYYTDYNSNKIRINIKYPSSPTIKQVNYIRDYVKSVDTAIHTKNINKINELLDVDSLIDYYLVQEVMTNWDARGKSVYMYKGLDTKLTFGPLWDFDIASVDSWTNEVTVSNPISHVTSKTFINGDNWFAYYIKTPEGIEKLKSRWMVVNSACNSVIDGLDEYKIYLARAAVMNLYTWYKDYLPNGSKNYQTNTSLFEDQYDGFYNYLIQRCLFLDNYINGL